MSKPRLNRKKSKLRGPCCQRAQPQSAFAATSVLPTGVPGGSDHDGKGDCCSLTASIHGRGGPPAHRRPSPCISLCRHGSMTRVPRILAGSTMPTRLTGKTHLRPLATRMTGVTAGTVETVGVRPYTQMIVKSARLAALLVSRRARIVFCKGKQNLHAQFTTTVCIRPSLTQTTIATLGQFA